jgi:hypothetical protein
MSGCAKIAIALFIVAVVAVIAFVFLIGQLFSNIATNLGANGPIGVGNDGGAECSFLSDADARTVFGGQADAFDLSGLYDVSLGFILDKRVLETAPDCGVSDGAKAYIARIALYTGGDSGSVFAAERTAAQPTSEDQGGGVTIENPGYLGADVPGLGDEAFCTDLSNALMAGVLVHQGDRLVYVSVGAADETVPEGPRDLCATAQEVARFMLR